VNDTGPRHPELTIELIGHDGNAFFVIGRVRRALRDAEVSADEVSQFKEEATGGDYDNLLQTVRRWVAVS
jgi:hypothetical protein